ncbi:MAG: hypothetical protein HXY24_12925 [Rubrivivax sp.]|nr:hypothetical protein [Rubrivivax sp.]
MTAITYHKTATKDVRPFFEAASLEQSLDGAQIRLFEDQPFTETTSFVIEDQEVGKLAVVVKPNVSDRVLQEGAIKRGKLALVVTAVNPFLKRTELVGKFVLSGPAPEEVPLGAEVLERLGGGANMTVDVALCLVTELAKEPGKPFMQGHWLAKKSFDLRPPKPAEDFGVEPMNDEGWKAMNLPAKTLYYVQYHGHVNEPANKDLQIAKVWIHEDVYKKLAADNNKLARPVMAFLAAEIPCQILMASFDEWKEAEAPEPRSPLSAFLKRINKAQPTTFAQLKQLLSEPGQARLRAILQADQQTVRQVAEA